MSDTQRPTIEFPDDLEGFFRNELPVYLKKVRGTEPALWGMMTIHHALEHLLLPLKFVTGEITPPLLTPPERLERMHAFLVSNMAFAQNVKFPLLPSDTTSPLEADDLEQAKKNLLLKVDEFLEIVTASDFSTLQHPLFGELNRREWLIFQYKHFHHHLAQFGLISAN